ncbi:MAG: helix-turn-helix domain-containing protein [Pseudomonadota bacterium]
MDIKPVRTEEDYEAALARIEEIFDAEPDTPEADELEILAALVEVFERKHYPLALPDPIEAIKIRMEDLGLDRKDLEDAIGSRGRISEILNRKRPLTLPMVQRLSDKLGLPIEVLAQPYSLAGTAGKESAGRRRQAYA